jgi:hypothetical protein
MLPDWPRVVGPGATDSAIAYAARASKVFTRRRDAARAVIEACRGNRERPLRRPPRDPKPRRTLRRTLFRRTRHATPGPRRRARPATRARARRASLRPGGWMCVGARCACWPRDGSCERGTAAHRDPNAPAINEHRQSCRSAAAITYCDARGSSRRLGSCIDIASSVAWAPEHDSIFFADDASRRPDARPELAPPHPYAPGRHRALVHGVLGAWSDGFFQPPNAARHWRSSPGIPTLHVNSCSRPGPSRSTPPTRCSEHGLLAGLDAADLWPPVSRPVEKRTHLRRLKTHPPVVLRAGRKVGHPGELAPVENAPTCSSS